MSDYKIKIILYRHKESELGLDCSKGFTLSFFDTDNDDDELATLDYQPFDEDIRVKFKKKSKLSIIINFFRNLFQSIWELLKTRI